MHLEEILAEKIARLSRLATARDASDLIWAAMTSPYSRFSSDRVRSIAILKVWVDNNGLRPGWSPAIAARPFDPQTWLSKDKLWDDEQIGLLTNQPPSLADLEADLCRLYHWLREMTEEEERWAQADPRDRGDVIRGIQTLPNSSLADVELW